MPRGGREDSMITLRVSMDQWRTIRIALDMRALEWEKEGDERVAARIRSLSDELEAMVLQQMSGVACAPTVGQVRKRR
jgi:hypothetical protein